MKTSTIDTSTGHEGADRRPLSGGNTRARIWAAATAAAVLAGFGVFLVLDDDSDSTNVGQAPLELTMGAGDALASCLPLEPGTLATMSPAFAATATAVQAGTVSLDVDKWYAGGGTDTVEVRAESGLESLIAGFDFEVGQKYLVTATGGSVNFCGYSGPATPELQGVFDQAFPAS